MDSLSSGRILNVTSGELSQLSLHTGTQNIYNDQLLFDGSTYYDFTPNEPLVSTYSVALQYTQTDGPPSQNYSMILSQQLGLPLSFLLGYFKGGGLQPGYYAGNWSDTFHLVGPIPIENGVPSDIVITFNSGTLTVYLNGSQTNIDTIPIVSGGSAQYVLGHSWDLGSGAPLVGSIKYLSMYNRLLSKSEISYLHYGNNPPPATCFLEDAPILTPDGYKPISSLKKGDHILTPEGVSVPIEKVKIRNTLPHSSVNPLVIPKGMYGATEALPISPDHKVLADGRMVEAKYLGLSRMMMLMPFDYYNLELPDYEQMVVAGVTVESLYPIMRIAISGDDFKRLIHNKYGSVVTEEQLAMIHKKVRYLEDGRVEVPVDKRLHLKEQTVINS